MRFGLSIDGYALTIASKISLFGTISVIKRRNASPVWNCCATSKSLQLKLNSAFSRNILCTKLSSVDIVTEPNFSSHRHRRLYTSSSIRQYAVISSGAGSLSEPGLDLSTNAFIALRISSWSRFLSSAVAARVNVVTNISAGSTPRTTKSKNNFDIVYVFPVPALASMA